MQETKSREPEHGISSVGKTPLHFRYDGWSIIPGSWYCGPQRRPRWPQDIEYK